MYRITMHLLNFGPRFYRSFLCDHLAALKVPRLTCGRPLIRRAGPESASKIDPILAYTNLFSNRLVIGRPFLLLYYGRR